MKYLLLVAIFLFSPVVNSAPDNDTAAMLFSGLQNINKKLDKTYLHYCGNEKNQAYKNGGWTSAKECLQDGRIHVVYANNEKGRHGVYKNRDDKEAVKFETADKEVLLDVIWEGATVYVGEHRDKEIEGKLVVNCVDAAVSNAGQAFCSTALRPYSLMPKVTGSYFVEWNRYSTLGYKEYQYRFNEPNMFHKHPNNEYKHLKIEWYVRY